MTLDPVHVDGIASLAGRLGHQVDETDHTDLAERAWEEFLDPLTDGESVLLEPLGSHRKHSTDLESVALEESPFPTQHAIDAGTINPTTFTNGLVLEVSQAAMASVPTAIDLHRKRTIVMTVHTNDDTVQASEADWEKHDRGHTRQRIMQTPRVDRDEQTVVHALALYMAESEHALAHAGRVSDLLVLDGPLYPTGLLKWVERDPGLKRLIMEAEQFTGVIENYFSLVERFVERDVPLVGFVKNTRSRALSRALRNKIGTPWLDDEAFFRRVLERLDDHGDPERDALTFTGWFRSRIGTDGMVVDDTLVLDTERALDREAYQVTFFVVYDPRDDLVYRVEAPYAFTRDEAMRERLTGFVLTEVAANRGPPTAVGKADSLARISQQGKETLRRRIEREFDTRRQRGYNDRRWGDLADRDSP